MPPSPPRRDRRAPSAPAGDRAVRKTSVLRVRRAALTRFGVWAALAAGPVALLASWGRPAPAAAERPATVTRTVQPETRADSGPAGYAELVLGLWLGAGSDANGATARQLRLLAPSVRIPEWGQRAVAVERLAAVRTVRENSGWAVTVAAQFTEAAQTPERGNAAGLRYFTIPVVLQEPGTSDAGGFAAAGAPMEVAGPAAGQMPASLYGSPVPDGPLADSVTGFLTAFLGAEGGADRYLAPGVTLPRPAAGDYIAVEVDQLLADRLTGGQDPGRDGAGARVRAEVTATDSAGRKWPLSYALSLTARAGRWEVAALGSGLDPAATTQAKPPAPSASSSASSRSTDPAAPGRTPTS
ncbi:conjugal transfer protein [Streptomyces sp. WAC01280]|uniref:conjugal transfer protein n=1 Tax=Streptomyces sp. WAC01280 TaxID=2487424 RepID=UPI000F76EA37|nr:conjugal transfer protein [Streptomyces sp. WAC01280]RSS57488.1 conjugal transfer protein [Streptomyces sp. WAC01280]